MASKDRSSESVDKDMLRAFEEAWRSSTPPRLEDYVSVENDGSRFLATLEELIRIELELAWQRWAAAKETGNVVQQPDPLASYLRRFSALNQPEIVKRLEASEREARSRNGGPPDSAKGDLTLELPGGKRAMAQVQPNQDPNSEDMMPTTAIKPGDYRESFDRSITQIGPYKLRQKLGEGGMGVVWMAEQQAPIRRQVAIKMIKHGMDSEHVVARFEQERQALAMMDHPNIAMVFDAGSTPTGQPYFVMELVKGLSITKYCDQEHLSPRERIELFLPVCQAVQHAHSKGIIHRDLKPSNVIVGLYDGKPVPKIIDFGVAKATLQRLTEHTMFTEIGAVVGTLEYMAPEQAELNNLDIDTRADVYSLGVILYELLTGSPPFTGKQLRGVAFDEMRRIIRELDPPRPSTKVSAAENLPTIAANRKLEPAKLTRVIRGDLDWIVMKCIEKERARRYETSSSLARDLAAYLSGDAIEAGPPRAWYRISKLVRRHRTAFSVIGLALVLLALGVIGSTTGWLRAREERDAKDRALVDTHAALKRETEARLEARRSQAYSELDYATQILERQDRRAGLLWLLRAWETMPEGDAKFDSFIRRDLAFWMQYHPPQFSIPHLSSVRAITFSPDGRFVATAGGQLRVWDSLTGEPVSPAMEAPFALSVHFSADGKRLVSTHYRPKNEIRIWDWAKGQTVAPPMLQLAPIDALFTPDGTTVISGGDSQPDGALRLWDAATGKPKDRTLAMKGGVYCLALDAKGKRVVVGSSEGHVRIWNMTTLEPLTAELPAAFPVDVAFSPDGKWIAAACKGGENCARVWDAETGKQVGTDIKHPRSGGVVHLRFSPQSDRLLTSSNDASVQLWKLDSQMPAQPLGSFIEQPTQSHIEFNHDGSRFVVACLQGNVSVWDSASVQPIGPPIELGSSILAASFHPRHDTLVIGEGNGLASVWDLRDSACQRQTIPSPSRIWDLAFTPDRKQLLVGMNSSRAVYYSLATGEQVRELVSNGNRSVVQLDISPGGEITATAGYNGIGQVWNSRGEQIGGELRAADGDHAMFVVNVSQDAKMVLVGSGNRFKLWDIATQHRLRGDWELADSFITVGEFSPDGSLVLVDLDSASFTLRSTSTGKRVGAAIPHQGYGVLTGAFNPSGDQVVVAQNDIRVWSVPEGKFLAAFGRDLNSRSIEFSDDGNLIAVACNDGAIRFFDMQVRRLIGPTLPQLAPSADELMGTKRYTIVSSFTNGGKELLAAGSIYWIAGRPIQIARWRIPEPLVGEREKITNDLTKRLGVKLDPDGSIRRIDR